MCLAPVTIQPMEPSAATHLLFSVLFCGVGVVYDSRRTRPHVLDVRQDDIFVVRLFNDYGHHNASSMAEALLLYMHSRYGSRGAGEGAGVDKGAVREAAERVAAT
jgi:hypothetical protein